MNNDQGRANHAFAPAEDDAPTFEPFDFSSSPAAAPSHLERLDLPNSPSPFEMATDGASEDAFGTASVSNPDVAFAPAQTPGTPNDAFASEAFTAGFYTSPQEATYKVVYKLLGDRSAAREILGRIVASEPDIATAVSEALTEVHRAAPGLIENGTLSESNVTHLSHRTRLQRDLRRWPSTEQLFLGLRHLAGLPIDMVATATNRNEAEVRAVTSTWVRQDALNGGEMLANLDSWIGAAYESPKEPIEDVPTLDHLDDPEGFPRS